MTWPQALAEFLSYNLMPFLLSLPVWPQSPELGREVVSTAVNGSLVTQISGSQNFKAMG